MTLYGPRGFPDRRIRARARINGVVYYLGRYRTKAKALAVQAAYIDAYCPDRDTCVHPKHVKDRGGPLTPTEARHKRQARARGETWTRT